jgi:outer membrane protein OmpA-like peptidoglycan-associated protein/uncharacterized protein YidB (DUF937 family)/osmotically-inducible protein OsmY
MSFLEPIIRELSQRFGLGANAGALAMEALRTITNERSGGLAAFINRFQTAGFGDLAASWIGKGENQSIEPGQLDTALGGDFIATIAKKVGLPASTAGAALAFIVPKLIDKLTPDGKVPSVLPTEVSALLSGGAPRAAVAAHAAPTGPSTAYAAAATPENKAGGGMLRKLLPLLGLLLLGLLAYWVFGGSGEKTAEAPSAAPSASAPAATAAGQAKPDAAATANPSQLALQNADGRILYSGTVPDGQSKSKIVDALNSVFGASAVTGSLGIDPSAAPPAWLDKLTAALGQFKIPGAEMLLKGDSIDIGGLLSDEAKNNLIAGLKSVFGEEFSVGKLTESLAGTLASAKAMAPAGAEAPKPAASANPSQLALQNADGRILYSGTVPDGQSKNKIVDALNSVFGASAVTGSLGIDPSAAPPAWLDKLTAALGQFKIPGAEMLLKGDSIDIGGLLSDDAVGKLIASLKPIFGEEFSVGKLTESLAGTLAAAKAMVPAAAAPAPGAGGRSPEGAQAANEKALAALKSLPQGYSADDLVEVLNASVITFETGSAVIAASDRDFLRTAANSISGAPAGSTVEIGGHTDGTGNAEANLALSQARADAVRDELIGFGSNPAMLTAKGYGGTRPVASDDTVQGREQNRRIEFTVVK